MNNSVKSKVYIDWKVYNVTPIHNKYGFRIKLYFNDNTSTIKQMSGYSTKKEAVKERENVITELNTGKFVLNDKYTVGELLEYWLENIIKPSCTYNTYTGYSNTIRKHIKPLIGNMELTNLNKGEIQKLYNNISNFSYNIAKLAKTIMNTSLKYALDKQLIKRNPALNVNLPKACKTTPNKKTLNLKQLKLLIKESENTDIHLQVLFATLMGLRRCEINGLKYTDIDFIHQKLKIERQLGVKPNTTKEDVRVDFYTKQEIDVKTFCSNRDLYIPDMLYQAIINEKKKYDANRKRRINDKTNPFLDENYICCSTYGKPRSPGYIWQHYKKLLKKCNLPDVRWHDLRASYASLLIKYNFSIKAVSKILGHAKEDITANVYTDKMNIIEDCLKEIEPFINDVLPEESDLEFQRDFSEDIELIKIIDKIAKGFT